MLQLDFVTFELTAHSLQEVSPAERGGEKILDFKSKQTTMAERIVSENGN